MPQPMQFDDPLVQEHCRREIEECWKFIEEQTGEKFDYDCFVKYIERYNELTRFEREKWDVAANTPYYPINGVAQALYRIYYSQDGWRDIWAQTDKGHQDTAPLRGEEDKRLPGDAPPRAGLELRAALLLPLVYLGV